MNQIILETEQSTQLFAEKLADQCDYKNKNLKIFLIGDLGTGKTTFTRYFIKAFGWQGKVKSPTYTLIEHYALSDLDIYHLDLYRLADAQELTFLGLEDIFNKPQSIILIEWPQKAGDLLPSPDIILKFDYINNQDTMRSVAVDYNR